MQLILCLVNENKYYDFILCLVMVGLYLYVYESVVL